MVLEKWTNDVEIKKTETNAFYLLLIAANSWQSLTTGAFPKESLFQALTAMRGHFLGTLNSSQQHQAIWLQ